MDTQVIYIMEGNISTNSINSYFSQHINQSMIIHIEYNIKQGTEKVVNITLFYTY